MYQDRKTTEQAFFDALAAQYEARHVRLVTFQMLKILLPSTLDNTLEEIVMTTLRTQEVNEKLGPAVVRNETEKAVAELRARLARDVAMAGRAIEQDRLKLTQKEQAILEDTKKAVATFAANATSRVAQYAQRTVNARTLLERNVTVTAQETKLRVSAIAAEVEVLRAAHNLAVAEVAAEARATATLRDGDARKYAAEKRAEALGSVYKAYKDDAGFAPGDLNALAWSEVLPAGETIYTDVHDPGTTVE